MAKVTFVKNQMHENENLMAAGTFFLQLVFFLSGKTLCYVLFFAGMYALQLKY